MGRCWCHAAMAGWLGMGEAGARAASPAAVLRWQAECERAGGDCAGRIEAIALRLPCARALRRGPLLKLFTARGDVEFLDRPEAGVQHRYLGVMEPGNRQLVWRLGGQGEQFLTVSDGDQFPSEFSFRGMIADLPHQQTKP